MRLGKKWRNFQEIKPLKSFHIELILAFLQDRNGASESIEQKLRDFFLYIAQSELKELIRFPENRGLIAEFDDPVVIVDPVNNSNNTTARVSEDERRAIVSASRHAWETANFASVEEDPEVWKELFGPHFKVKD